MSDNRECTCHPDEAPVPCQKQYAFTECEILRLRAENEKLREERDAASMEVIDVVWENEKLRAALKEARVKALNEGFDIAIRFNGMPRSKIAQAFERAKTAAIRETGDEKTNV